MLWTIWRETPVLPCVTSSTNSKPLRQSRIHPAVDQRAAGTPHHLSNKLQHRPAAAGLADISATPADSLNSRRSAYSTVDFHSTVSCWSHVPAWSGLTSYLAQPEHHRHNQQARVWRPSQVGTCTFSNEQAHNTPMSGCYSSYSSAHHCMHILPKTVAALPCDNMTMHR